LDAADPNVDNRGGEGIAGDLVEDREIVRCDVDVSRRHEWVADESQMCSVSQASRSDQRSWYGIALKGRECMPPRWRQNRYVSS
jgi:hypothetical protein